MRMLLTVASMVMLVSASAAIASTITYQFSDASANFGIYGTDTITGTFTYNTTTNTVLAANIAVTGLFDPGHYTTDPSATPSSIFAYNTPSHSDAIQITFVNNLGSSSDPLTNVSFYYPPFGSTDYLASAFAGGTVTPSPSATPLPTALPLFASGLAGVGLFGWIRRRKRKGVAVASF